jgi:altronate dehydratase
MSKSADEGGICALCIDPCDTVAVAMCDIAAGEIVSVCDVERAAATFMGRGTLLGFAAPTLKIASNTAVAESKPRWIDFDAGRVLDAADRLFDLAAGELAGNERNDERRIAFWKMGVTL